MPLQSTISIENNFTKGLITEASGFNFPENACTETFDCEFNIDGTVERRLGFDFENNFLETTIDRTDSVISTYLWKNVAGDGNTTLFVSQIGSTVYFYDVSGPSISAGLLGSSIDLTAFTADGSPSPDVIECQYSSGNKYLIITHLYCDPIRVSYDSSTQIVTGTSVSLKIRDLEGDTADDNAIDNRPTASLGGLDVHHKYNLYNQGWITTNLTSWDSAFTTMPSNADVMYRFKNTSDAFDTSTVANVVTGNTPAPKGHFILTLCAQDRDIASGLTGTTSTTSSYFRPTTSAWFSGRVFYGGIGQAPFNSKVYFTQILERDEQYGYCYQANDPTAEDTFDLLPSDGGVISIPEAGTILKIVAIQGYLLLFANNGVWAVSGSTGLGFTATDYTVQKLSTINAISATSFVDIAGFPAWWNDDGIYVMAIEGTIPSIKSLTLTTIKSFYDEIPSSSKLYARGFYNTVTGVAQWIYRDIDSATPTETYTFNKILNLNTSTGAFYPWTISNNVSVNGIVVLQGTAGGLIKYNIVDDDSDNIVDDDGNNIVSFGFISTTGSRLTFKYLVSYPNESSYKFTIAETNNINYLDWESFVDGGDSYTSYFITGYKIRAQGLKKFQSNWVNVFSKTEEAVKYYFNGIWDYAKTGSGTGRWSPAYLIEHTNTDYSNAMRRIKILGHGKVLQFKITSFTGKPFNIVGWSTFDTGNTLP